MRPPAAAAPPGAAGLRVLIAEDNAVNQVVVTQAARKARLPGRCGRQRPGGGRGGAAAPYHIVLMDVQMPEMDGLAATAAIRALPQPDRRDVWIVALTANAFAEDRSAASTPG